MKKVSQLFLICFFLMVSMCFPLTICAQNTSLPVGAIPATDMVTSMGSASYSIPIEVVPGTQGVQPSLAVVYNSISNYGMLGLQMDLSGLSVISRTGKNQFHDHANGFVGLDYDDRYMLDGTRLISRDPTLYGQDGVEYYSEFEDFRKTVSYGIQGNGPQYFKVFSDDGSVLEYGNTDDSRQTLGGTAVRWFLNRYTDVSGNFITYSYGKSGNEIWLKQIDYTGNTSARLKPYARVKFEYDSGYHINSCFIAGHQIRQTRLLKSVIVQIKTGISYSDVRQYLFSYTSDSPKRLVSVQLVAQDGQTTLNPTSLSWTEPSFGEVDTTWFVSNLFQNDATHVAVDFNKDGLCDIVENDSQYSYYWSNTGHAFQLTHTESTNGFNVFQCIPADVDGDGFSELLTIYRKNSGETFVTSTSFYGNALHTQLVVDTFNTTSLQNALTGDFFGNGNQQLLLRYNSTSLAIFGYDRGTFTKRRTTVYPGNVQIVDFDGDGQMEFLVINGAHLYLYKYNAISGIEHVKQLDAPSQYIVNWGDFNGDGITDMLYRDYNSVSQPEYRVALGTGTDYFENVALNLAPYHTATNIPVIVADINNDGYDDILTFVRNSNGGIKVRHYLGSGFHDNTIHFSGDNIVFLNSPVILSASESSNNFTIGDFNNDQHLDILAFRSANATQNGVMTYSFGSPRQHYVIHEIAKGDGSFVRWLYADIHGLYYRYASYVRTIPYHFSVVDTLIHSGASATALLKKGYKFMDPMYSYYRRQLLGYRTTVTCDMTTHVTDTLFQENQKANGVWQDLLMPVRRKTYMQQSLVEKTEYRPRCLQLSLRRLVPYFENITTTNFLSETVSATRNILDVEGRLCSTSREVRDLHETDFLQKDSVRYTYVTKMLPDGFSVVREDSIITKSFLQNCSTAISKLQTFEYNALGLPLESRSFEDGVTVTKRVNNYDYFGNATSLTERASGSRSRTVSKVYDPSGRFPVSETNVAGHNISVCYEPSTGNVLSATDANNLTTRYVYDLFGQLDTIYRPDGTTSVFLRRWYTGTEFPNAKRYTVTITTGLANKEEYFNLLGQKVCGRENGSYTDFQYNADGSLYRTSEPYMRETSNADKIWHTYLYDAYGRIAQEYGPYTNRSYTYSGRTTSVTDNLRHTLCQKSTDALGRVTNFSDPGGSVYYAYSIAQNNTSPVLQTTITANGHTTIIKTDQRGNRIFLSDPDAGAIISTYNSLNQLTQQVDARGCTTAFEYDILGRITRKTYTNQEGEQRMIQYAYDTYSSANRGRGKLSTITLDGVLSESFSYDSFGRQILHTSYIDGMAFEESCSYNALGQVADRTSPDGQTFTYGYLSNGRLETISQNSGLLLRICSYNLCGQPLRYSFKNGTATDFEYNSTGMLTHINTGNKQMQQPERPPFFPLLTSGLQSVNPSSPVFDEFSFNIDSSIQNLHYGYDELGRLVQRTQKNSRIESFQYDNLDRLTSFSQGIIDGTAHVFTTSYDSQGNIQSSTLAGAYQYDGDQPHAVTSVTPSTDFPDAIPASQCETEYNLLNQPSRIAEGEVEILLFYGADGQRNKVVFKRNGVVERTRYYISANYEKEIAADNTVTHYNYIYSPTGLAIVCVRRNNVDSLYYVYPDRLGSYTHITNSSKQVVRALHFDPWGNVKSDGYFHSDYLFPHTSVSSVPLYSDVIMSLNGFSMANGFKTNLMDAAVAYGYKSEWSRRDFVKLKDTQNAFRYNQTLGKTGAMYLKGSKWMGGAASITSARVIPFSAAS